MPSKSSDYSAFAQWLVRLRLGLFVAGVLLVAILIPAANRLEFDQSIESMFSPDDPLLKDYLESKRCFGGDEFAIIAWEQADLLSQDTLDEIHAFARQLSAIPGIDPGSTESLAKVLRPEGVAFVVRLYLKLPNTHSQLIDYSTGLLVGSDLKTTAVMVRLLPAASSPVPRVETIRLIREAAQQHQPPALVVGEPVQVQDMFRYVEEDGRVLGLASTGILLVVVLFLFRSLRWVALPLLVVHGNLILTRALLMLSGIKLSMVSSMLNTLVTIVGVTTVMHITVAYRSARRTHNRSAALKTVIDRLYGPIFWTVATTMLGFAALLSSEIVPVRSFGLMMLIGVGMLLVTMLLFVPAGILSGRLDPDPRSTPGESAIEGWLSAIATQVTTRPKFWIISLLALFAWSAAGLQYLTIETDFSKNFRSSSPIVQALDFVEEHLGGAGSWEVNFPFPADADNADLAPVRELMTMAGRTRTNIGGGVTKLLGLPDGVDLIPRVAGKSLSEKLDMISDFQPNYVPTLYNPSAGRMRVVLKSRERQPSEAKLALINAIETEAAKIIPGARTTGLFVLLANLIESLLADQLTSFAIAGCGIVLAVTMAFRNLSYGLIALLPNVFPVVVLIGTLGWLDVPVNIGTAMIASVSLGLTVDSSVHYLYGYQRAMLGGGGHANAVLATHLEVGLPLILANVALVCGFLVLTLSQFIPLVYFGVLVSVAMIGGLVGNLVLLPVLLGFLSSNHGTRELQPPAASPTSQ